MFPRRSGTLRGTKIRSFWYSAILYALACNWNQLRIIPNHRKLLSESQSTIMGSKWIEATVVTASTQSSFVISMREGHS